MQFAQIFQSRRRIVLQTFISNLTHELSTQQDPATEVNTVAELEAMFVEVKEVESGPLYIMAAEETFHYKVRCLEYFKCQTR